MVTPRHLALILKEHLFLFLKKGVSAKMEKLDKEREKLHKPLCCTISCSVYIRTYTFSFTLAYT